ncbi:MAG: AAA family ATPase [Candidatus Aminicenantes bacterium]|jgi:orc1/cdc6 family replication initiation protein
MGQHFSVVTKPDPLYENYNPTKITGREVQVKELSYCLEPAIKKMKPVHAWLYGESGTGKTLVVKYILRKLQREAYVDGVYINCWENNSYYSVLDKLVRELRILGAEKLNTAFKLERFHQFIGKRPFIIILDEIDQAKKPETGAIIYNLCNVGNTGIICISKSRLALYTLDERIQTRLNAKQIAFLPYTENELFIILKQRTFFSLRPGACSDCIFRFIARLAEGNSRIAIQILRNAAYIAEREQSKTIKLRHIKAAHNSSKDLEKSYLLDRLSSHHRLLYELVKEKKEVNSGDLWKAYLQRCREIQKHPIALRTYSDYMNKLIELELVQWDRALVKGKVRAFKICD